MSSKVVVEDALFNIHVAGEYHSFKREDGDVDAFEKTEMETLLGRRKRWRRSWQNGSDGDALGKTKMETLLGDGNTSYRYRNYNSTSNMTCINQNYDIAPQILR